MGFQKASVMGTLWLCSVPEVTCPAPPSLFQFCASRDTNRVKESVRSVVDFTIEAQRMISNGLERWTSGEVELFNGTEGIGGPAAKRMTTQSTVRWLDPLPTRQWD